jgi:hypothetical protein
MKISSNSKIYISMLLFATIALPMLSIPAANAHSPAWTIPTHAYVIAAPDTVGRGDTTAFVMWLDWVPPTAGGLGGDRWQGFKLDVTKPDGTKQTLGPFTSGPVGTTYTLFTPDQVGNYTIVFSWPGQTATNGTGTPNYRGAAYVGDYFKPSTSNPITLVVTQTSPAGWPESPLPTGIWARPINNANRDWSQIASNWLGGSWLVSNFQVAGRAPETPHILWQKLIAPGGTADAQWPGQPYDTNDYQSPWSTPIVMNGVIYYNKPQDTSTARYGYYAVDLMTGQQLWYKNGTDNGLNNPVSLVGYASGANQAPELHQSFPTLSFGQLYHYYSVNGQGTQAYLWMTVGSTWHMLSAWDGNWIMSLKNVPGGTAVTDQDGSLLRYSYTASTGQLLCWNSSQSIPPSGPTGTGQQIWKPRVGAVIDAVNDSSWTAVGPRANQWDAIDVLPRSGYTMNVTTSKGLPGISRVVQNANREPKLIFGLTIDPPIATGGLSEPTNTFRAYALRINEHAVPYSPSPDRTFTQNNNLGFSVTLLWDKNFTNPLSGQGVSLSLGAVDYDSNIFIVKSKETMQMWAYDLTTGSLVWGPSVPQNNWQMYGINDQIAYGKLYSVGYGGTLYAQDAKTGNLLWTYVAKGVGFESPYGNYPLNIGAIADGKIYLYSTEHSPTKPLWRGSYVRCVDATTGQELWKLLDYNMGMAVADGYIVSGDQYDNNMVVIGKGPSKITVETQMNAAPKGTPVLIQGTVTDQSPGAKDTPAIADANMGAWMEYLYKQQVYPANAKGVTVKVTAIDPNGNSQDVGTATSDVNGFFKLSWTPPVEGAYTVVAKFEGSKAYAASVSETALLVGPAAAPAASPTAAPTQVPLTPAPTVPPTAEPTPAPTVAPTPPAAPEPVALYAGIAAIVIVVVIAVAAVALKRRK